MNFKKELKNINDEMASLGKKRRGVISKLQAECKHTKIEKSGGGMWHEWPDYGYEPTFYECLDCKKVWNQEKIGWDEKSMLEKNIVKDTSR